MKNYKKQIALFLYVSLVVVIGSFALLFINFRKQVKLQKEILQLQASLIQADTLSNNLLQLESDKRGFQLTNDVNYLRNFYTLKSNSREIIAKLKKNIISKAGISSIARIDSLVKLRMANLDSNIVVITTQGFDAGVAVMQLNDRKNTRVQLYQQIALFRNDIVQRLKENSATINKRSRQNLSGILVLMAVFVLLILVAARTFRRSSSVAANRRSRKARIGARFSRTGSRQRRTRISPATSAT